ncbi:hypothetical protein HK405_008107 [Cladochytrium tenue]|nr:hypothetical protein HK405_008107 [Cladochytrium tenue]
MFEALVTSVLNKVLGDYVGNLEAKQLNVAIWEGAVVLQNLRLRREALDKFNLPVDVLEGYLGELTINIPWNDLKNKPVQIFINNVYVLATPKADADYDPDLEEERLNRVKMEKIEALELLENSKGKIEGVEDQQKASFLNQLVTKIVDNLQVSIKNIHVRYEDRQVRGRPFSLGVTFSEFSAVSTDENWNEAFIHEEKGVIHKLIKLGSLAMYWNTDSISLANLSPEESIKRFTDLIAAGSFVPAENQYMLKPVTGFGRDVELLQALERKLSFKDIRFYRTLAANELKREQATQAATQPQPVAPKTTIQWISDWWSGAEPQKAAETTVLSEQQMKQLLETIDDEKEPFFTLEFEHNPLDERADDAVKLRLLPLQVIINPVSINGVLEFFTPPPSEFETLSALQSVAQDTIQGISAQTRAGLEYAIGVHRTIDVKVDIAAPIIVFPESVTTRDSMVVVVDAGHLLVESNLVNKQTKKELEGKQGADLSEMDFAKLESLLYDRFTCTLTSAQILVSHSVDFALHEVFNNHGQNSPYHFLEKVDLSFNIELCILPRLARHVRLAVTGKLPRLHINLSDMKYKTIMRIIDLVLTQSFKSTNQATQAIAVQPIEWSYDNDGEDILLKADAEDSFFDAAETIENNSVLPTPLDSPDKELLRFTFEVGEVSASLSRSEKQLPFPEKSLAELRVSGFNLNFLRRPLDMSVSLRIRSVSVEDLLHGVSQAGPQFLLAPCLPIVSDENFILVEYTSAKESSPDYKGFDQTVDVSFASVDVNLLKESVLELYDFLLATFTGGKNAPQVVDKRDNEQTLEPTTTDQKTSTMIIRTSMKSVNFIIHQNHVQIATASFDAGQLSVKLLGSRMEVAGRLGNFAVADNMACSGNDYLYRQLLRIDGSEVADFTFDTFDPNEPGYPGYDSALRLRTSSVRITFLKPLLKELSNFSNEFLRLHFLLEAGRRAAQGTQERVGKFHYDLQIETPIVEFPDETFRSPDMVIMYLGRIAAKNSFSDDGLSQLEAGIHSVKLVSSFGVGDSNQVIKMIEDVNVDAVISSAPATALRPPTTIKATVSEIKSKLGRKQYSFLMNTINSVSDFLSGGPRPEPTIAPADDFGEDDETTAMSMSGTFEAKVTTDMSLSVASISLEICHEALAEDDSSTSIAKFSIDSLKMNLALLDTGEQQIEAHVRWFSILDTRPGSGNLFCDIMPHMDLGQNQLSVKASRKPNFNTYFVTLDSIKLIVVMEHLFAIQQFLMAENANSGSQDTSVSGVEEPVGEICYRVNIIDLEMILLQNPKLLSTEAIILVGKEVVISYDQVLSLSVLDMGMFFCVMDRRADTTLRFIQNFDLTVAMDHRTTAPGHVMTNISVDVSPLMLRVSYHDILLISEIFNQFTSLSQSSPKSAAVGIGHATEDDLVNPVTRIVMSRERIQATTQGIRLILIDDLNDVQLPMFDFVVDKLVVEIADWSSSMRVDAGVKLHVNYFNTKNSHWEPLVELFEFYLNLSRQDGATSVDIYARKKLEVNISHVFVETFLNTMNLMISTESSVAQTPNKLSLQMHGPAWETLKSIAVDREGTQFYTLRPNIGKVSHRIVCDVKMKNNVKIVTFRSATVVLNSTNITVDVSMVNGKNQPTWGVCTLGAFGYLWSSESLFWKDIQRPESLKAPSLISCAAPDPATAPFRFQVNVAVPPNKMHLMSQYPCMTIKLLPPFQVENLLPYDIRYVIVDKDTGQRHRGGLSKGAVDSVHTIDPTHALVLSVEIPGLDFRQSDVAVLNNLELDYRTGLDLKYRARSIIGSPKLAAGQAKERGKDDLAAPFMFSYTNFEPLRNRALLQVEDSEFSKPISFEAVGSSYDVTIGYPLRGQDVRVGVSVKEGVGKVK